MMRTRRAGRRLILILILGQLLVAGLGMGDEDMQGEVLGPETDRELEEQVRGKELEEQVEVEGPEEKVASKGRSAATFSPHPISELF